MNIYGKDRLKWDKNVVMFQGRKMFSYEQDKTQKKMYWVVWPNGEKSKDYYNLTWAKQHCIDLSLQEINKQPSTPNLEV